MDWLQRGADATKGFSTLTAIIGATPSHEPESQDIGDRLEAFTRLDANIRVAGDPDTIREAQRRWTIDQPLSPIALKVRRLSQSYDNWFLLVKPFSVFAAMPADVADTTGPPQKYRHDLIDAVEEISGGVRFGTINEFYLEASFETQKTPGLQPLFRVGCREFYNWNNPTLIRRPYWSTLSKTSTSMPMERGLRYRYAYRKTKLDPCLTHSSSGRSSTRGPPESKQRQQALLL